MEILTADLGITENYKLLVGLIGPRPIAWISTISPSGVYNLAPHSFFTGASHNPLMILFVSTRRPDGPKDTMNNIEATHEFVMNVVTRPLAEAMNVTSGDHPPDVDEFAVAGLTPIPSDLVKPPRVAESPVSVECRLVTVMEFGRLPTRSAVIFGEILKYHIRDELYYDGKIDVSKLRPLGRLAGDSYCTTDDIFSIRRAPQFRPDEVQV